MVNALFILKSLSFSLFGRHFDCPGSVIRNKDTDTDPGKPFQYRYWSTRTKSETMVSSTNFFYPKISLISWGKWCRLGRSDARCPLCPQCSEHGSGTSSHPLSSPVRNAPAASHCRKVKLWYWIIFLTLKSVFRIRIRPDTKIFCLKDADPRLSIRIQIQIYLRLRILSFFKPN